MSYKAIVTRLKNVRPHSNADRVQLATCHGNQVVIGLNSQEGELGVYFPSDGQLSPEFCKENKLDVWFTNEWFGTWIIKK